MARRLFLRLVHVADDAPPTRSVVRLAELQAGARVPSLLGRFVDERLITVDADHAQIAHDALLTAWPRLRSWIDAGQERPADQAADHRGGPDLGGDRAGQFGPAARPAAGDRQRTGRPTRTIAPR